MRLDLVVGPNGSGKSTYIETTLVALMPWNVVVNADVIAAQRWPGDATAHAYDAARIAERTRAQLIARRQPFIAETVFSHPAKLDLVRAAQAADFMVALHVLLVPE
ncbi:MAG TPA: AAA family ATPase, partial [Jatrophihabitantaceae bacterium]|nr:AAA family ATPase [Jatrophihabitantaceae bacterium]